MEDTNKKRPKDSGSININNEQELNWWVAQLGIEKQKIQQAVKTVGSSLDAVRRYLKNNS